VVAGRVFCHLSDFKSERSRLALTFYQPILPADEALGLADHYLDRYNILCWKPM
jgi:hypothetical protein